MVVTSESPPEGTCLHRTSLFLPASGASLYASLHATVVRVKNKMGYTAQPMNRENCHKNALPWATEAGHRR